MMRRLVRAVIRGVKVTKSEGTSLRIDPILLRAANILPLEEVEIVSHATGERFASFAEEAEEGSGAVTFGRVRQGDAVSVVSWGLLHDGQTLTHRASIVSVGEGNRLTAVAER